MAVVILPTYGKGGGLFQQPFDGVSRETAGHSVALADGHVHLRGLRRRQCQSEVLRGADI